MIAYFTTFFLFLIIDAVWLYFSNSLIYQKQIGHLMSKSVDWIAAGIFYPLYIFGIHFFIVQPALQNSYSPVKTLLYGALFGLICYGTYDLTNQATLKDWPWLVTVIDLIWGATITGVVSMLTVLILNR